MKISLCSGCLFLWHNQYNIDATLKTLELIKDLDLDGFELHMHERELLNEEFKRLQGKLGKYLVTFHMPHITKSTKEVFDKLRKLVSLLKVKYVVVHADEWDKLEEKPADIPFVIENCDKNKCGFQDLRDVAEFKRGICLDINHIEENFPGKMHEQVVNAKDKIKEVHVSYVKNPLCKELKLSAPHYLVTGSGYKIPGCVPKNVIWVIEGVVPKDRLDLLEKEIELLRNLI